MAKKSKKSRSKKGRKSRKARKTGKRKLSVAAHRKIRPRCKNCGVRHSKMSHRSHGFGSYARTRGKRRRAKR